MVRIPISYVDIQSSNYLSLMHHKGISFGHFGVSQMSADDATNLFEIIEDRTEVNFLIITSQLPVSQWYDYLNHGTVADAILDRVVHSSHRIELEEESMRKLKSKIKHI